MLPTQAALLFSQTYRCKRPALHFLNLCTFGCIQSGNMKDESVFRNKNLYIIFGVTLTAMMGVASITPAFPDIIRYFDIRPEQVGLLIVAFTLPGIFLTPFTGMLADHYGRKKVLIPSLFLFGVAGAACMFAPGFYWLLGLRFLQGVGASSLSSMNITLVGDLFEGKQRTAVMGYNASVLSIGTASYPALGGVIAIFGWQYIFLLPLLAIPLGFWVMNGLNNPEPHNKAGLRTYFGRVWKTINQRTVWGLLIINFMIFLILYGTYLTYFPLMMEKRLGADSYHIGLMMSLMSVTTALMSSQLGRINQLLGLKRQLGAGQQRLPCSLFADACFRKLLDAGLLGDRFWRGPRRYYSFHPEHDGGFRRHERTRRFYVAEFDGIARGANFWPFAGGNFLCFKRARRCLPNRGRDGFRYADRYFRPGSR